jgi:hypothetical protein
LIIRRLSIEPWVVWATATSPGTPQLPGLAQVGVPGGLEIALATMPPISKKLPAVAAVPMRKKRASSAATALPSSAAKTKLAQTKLRQHIARHATIVSRRETVMDDDSMLATRLQPGRPGSDADLDNDCSPQIMSATVAAICRKP